MGKQKPFAVDVSQQCGSFVLRHEVKRTAGWEQWYLLRSDAHYDNPSSDHAMELRHLRDAIARGAGILDFGDLFDAMQGRDDRRRSYSELGPDFKQDDYFDRCVKLVSRAYKPYFRNWVLLVPGNHESAVLKHASTNLTERFAQNMRDTGSSIQVGGYRGYVRFMFKRDGNSISKVLYWTHGSGGSAPVTKGTIKTARRAAYINSADFVVSAHTHDAWLFPVAQEELSDGGVRRRKVQWHIQCPSYLDSWAARDVGFVHEKEFPPQPIGAWWLRFYYVHDQLKHDIVFAQ